MTKRHINLTFFHVYFTLRVAVQMKPHKNIKMKLARVAKDLTQEELAERIGATRQTIGLIEAGKYNPTLNLCTAICRALGKTLDDIFWDSEVNP